MKKNFRKRLQELAGIYKKDLIKEQVEADPTLPPFADYGVSAYVPWLPLTDGVNINPAIFKSVGELLAIFGAGDPNNEVNEGGNSLETLCTENGACYVPPGTTRMEHWVAACPEVPWGCLFWSTNTSNTLSFAELADSVNVEGFGGINVAPCIDINSDPANPGRFQHGSPLGFLGQNSLNFYESADAAGCSTEEFYEAMMFYFGFVQNEFGEGWDNEYGYVSEIPWDDYNGPCFGGDLPSGMNVSPSAFTSGAVHCRWTQGQNIFEPPIPESWDEFSCDEFGDQWVNDNINTIPEINDFPNAEWFCAFCTGAYVGLPNFNIPTPEEFFADMYAAGYDPIPPCECCEGFEGPDTPDIYGCTDEWASNYDPIATINDGSCTFEICPDGIESTDLIDFVANVVPLTSPVQIDDVADFCQTCVEGPGFLDNWFLTGDIEDNWCYCCDMDIVPGCTDPTATNYDPDATTWDGTCTYTQEGCPPEVYESEEWAIWVEQGQNAAGASCCAKGCPPNQLLPQCAPTSEEPGFPGSSVWQWVAGGVDAFPGVDPCDCCFPCDTQYYTTCEESVGCFTQSLISGFWFDCISPEYQEATAIIEENIANGTWFESLSACDPECPYGCMDSNALNFDDTATLPCIQGGVENACCIYPGEIDEFECPSAMEFTQQIQNSSPELEDVGGGLDDIDAFCTACSDNASVLEGLIQSSTGYQYSDYCDCCPKWDCVIEAGQCQQMPEGYVGGYNSIGACEDAGCGDVTNYQCIYTSDVKCPEPNWDLGGCPTCVETNLPANGINIFPTPEDCNENCPGTDRDISFKCLLGYGSAVGQNFCIEVNVPPGTEVEPGVYTYATIEECEKNCGKTYACKQSPNGGECYEDSDGEYNSLEECETAVQQNKGNCPERRTMYECRINELTGEGNCVPDSNGQFATQDECEKAGCGEITCWACVEGTLLGNNPIIFPITQSFAGTECPTEEGFSQNLITPWELLDLNNPPNWVTSGEDPCDDREPEVKHTCRIISENNCQCVPDATGEYNSLEECQNDPNSCCGGHVTPPPPPPPDHLWYCQPGKEFGQSGDCVMDPTGVLGIFPTYEVCMANSYGQGCGWVAEDKSKYEIGILTEKVLKRLKKEGYGKKRKR